MSRKYVITYDGGGMNDQGADTPADMAEVDRIEAFIVDLNGVPRGKWISPKKVAEFERVGMPMPRSLFAEDIWGDDVMDAGLAFGTGDPDGLCFPVEGGIVAAPWTQAPAVQMLCSMRNDDGSGFFADPRVILQNAVERLRAMGLKPVVAVELEFYLLAGGGPPRPVRLPRPGDGDTPFHAGNVASVDELGEFESFLNDVFQASQQMNLPLDTVFFESGPGQFEINLVHGPDPCVAADHAILLKRCVKGIAMRHGMRACFMAKPFGGLAGSGMHVHTSLLDAQGRPFFADPAGGASSAFLHAIGGLTAAMPDTMLIFAPHSNSYRRFQRDSHAPLTSGWAWGDRSAAVRAIDGKPSALRIEHRVAGADANPYLVLATVLSGIADGLTKKIDPGPAQDGAPSNDPSVRLPLDWRQAIERFEASELAARHLGERARDVIAACKWQDFDRLLAHVPPAEYETYLGTV